MNAKENLSREEIHDLIFETALTAGCTPEWLSGMFGLSWHCGCRDNKHGCDTQCSAILLSKGTKGRWKIRPKVQ